MSQDCSLESFVRMFGGNCPLCGTALAGGSTRCPRCRQELRLGLKVVEPYLYAWGISVGGTGISAGVGLILLCLVLVRPRILHLGSPGIESVNICVIGLGVLAAAGVGVLLAKRRAFCRLSRPVQWVLAAVALFLAILSFTGPAIMFR